MSDRGSFKAQSDALRAAATMWGDIAGDMGKARTEIVPGVGGGDSFGVLAGSSGVSTSYDNWSAAMLTAIERAEANFRYLQDSLNSTADDYDGVDATVAADMATLDRRIEP